MRKLIAGNWKEHPKTEKAALALFEATARIKRKSGVEVAACPPFIYLEEVSRQYKKLGPAARRGFSIGAQDAFFEEQGAFTGEVGPKMLRSLGVTYVIIGHSERRKFAHETDAAINKKIALALRDGLAVILCVGEPLAVRRKGAAAAKAFVRDQLGKDLKNISYKSSSLMVAYEPIWAIGSGLSDRPEDAREMAIFIKATVHARKRTKIGVLYGGSVTPANAANYVQLKEIDGALVGGASLKAESFGKIIDAAN